MTTTFNGIAFGFLTTDFVPFPLSQELFTTEHHVPYSSAVNVVDIGGKGPRKFSGTIRVPGLTAMQAYLTTWKGQTYTLIVNDVNYGAATLVKAENARYDPGAHYALIDVEWILAT